MGKPEPRKHPEHADMEHAARKFRTPVKCCIFFAMSAIALRVRYENSKVHRLMIDEASLSKGQLRKLNALRKSLGLAIANEAFSKWLEQAAEVPETDKNAETIAGALWNLVQEDKLMIRRGGYIVRRGRGRIIVEPAGA